eukprot:scaffold85634_cov26-Tisochrysis_lutea.AAC.1
MVAQRKQEAMEERQAAAAQKAEATARHQQQVQREEAAAKRDEARLLLWRNAHWSTACGCKWSNCKRKRRRGSALPDGKSPAKRVKSVASSAKWRCNRQCWQ